MFLLSFSHRIKSYNMVIFSAIISARATIIVLDDNLFLQLLRFWERFWMCPMSDALDYAWYSLTMPKSRNKSHASMELEKINNLTLSMVSEFLYKYLLLIHGYSVCFMHFHSRILEYKYSCDRFSLKIKYFNANSNCCDIFT